MKKKVLLTTVFVLGCIVVMLLSGYMIYGAKTNFGDKSHIIKGVKIEGNDVGGLKENAALDKVSAYSDKIIDRQVNIEINGQTVVATFGALGVSCDDAKYVEKATLLGKTGNVFKRFSEINKAAKGKINYDIDVNFDDDKLVSFVEDRLSIFNKKVRNSRLKLINGNLRATKSSEGVFVDVDATVEALRKLIKENSSAGDDLSIDAEVEIKKPKYTKNELRKCTDLLGSFSTSYGSSSADRASNVQTACKYINGTVVYPGKTFSTIKTIKDRTVENGYKVAAEYSSGMVVDGVGGGVCQVATTLYNAVLFSELKVVERSPHSMVVAYVPHSRDAAISGDYKDFKFKNNTKYPVYLVGSASGGILTFKIFGNDTRASNRKIEFVSEDTETLQPGDPVEKVDKTKPAGYREVTQSAHIGYKSKLWKVIYVDGVETKRVQVNDSKYNAEPEYITVGKAAEASPSPSPSPSDDSAKEDKKENKKENSDSDSSTDR
ncbi:MAG: VanW family protein [Lachnospiraceae bacterium]|nr:VanW family protein [Lachnospiraceae bacterium]